MITGIEPVVRTQRSIGVVRLAPSSPAISARTGCSPVDNSMPVAALRQAICDRMEQAQQLLLNPHYTIAEIADELGFSSVEAFSRAFQRVTTRPPEDFRVIL